MSARLPVLFALTSAWLFQGGAFSAAAQEAENARLIERNEVLAAEVEDLRAGKAVLEERARAELGLIKPGETFYRVIEARPAPDQVP